MCEWVDVCPSTGKSVEEAPCKVNFEFWVSEALDVVATRTNKLIGGDDEMGRLITTMLLEERMKNEWLHTGWQLMAMR